MFRMKTLAVSIAALSFGSAAQAVNLVEAYQDAIANDAQLQAAEARFRASNEGPMQSLSNLLPQISATANTTHTHKHDKKATVDRNEHQESNRHGYSLTMSQTLFNASQWFDLDSATASAEGAKASFEAEQQALMVRIAEAYFGVLQALDGLKTTQAQETSLLKQLEQAKERHNVGLIAITDVLDAQASYDDAVVQRLDAEVGVTTAKDNLFLITNTAYDVLDRVSKDFPVTGPQPESLSEWKSFANANNKTIISSKKAVESSQAGLYQARSAFAPSISLDGSVNRNFSNLKPGGRSSYTDSHDASIGLSLTVPILAGGGNYSRAKQAGYSLEAAQYDLDNTQRTVMNTTSQLHQQVTTDVERISARIKAIESSLSAYEAANEGYKVGTRTIVDVLDAQQRAFSTISTYDQSRYDYILNSIRLKEAAGTLNPEDLSGLNEWLSATEESSVDFYLGKYLKEGQ